MKLAREEHVKGATELLFRMEKEYLVAVKEFRNRCSSLFDPKPEPKKKNKKKKRKRKKKISAQKIEGETDSENEMDEDAEASGSDKENALITDNFGTKVGGQVVFGEQKAFNRERLIDLFSAELERGDLTKDRFEGCENTLWLHPDCLKINSAVKSRGMTFLAQNSKFAVRDLGNLKIGFSDLIHIFFEISNLIFPEVSCFEKSEKRKFVLERLMGYWYMVDQHEIETWETNLAANLVNEEKRKEMSEIIGFESGYLDDSPSFSTHLSDFKYESKSGKTIEPYYNVRDHNLTHILCQCNDLIKTDNCSLCRKFLFMCDKVLDLKMNDFCSYFSNVLEMFVFYSYKYLQGKRELSIRKKTRTSTQCYLECEKLARENEFYKFVVGFCLRNWRHFAHYVQDTTRIQNYFYLFDKNAKKFETFKELKDLDEEMFPWLIGTNPVKPNMFRFGKKDIFFLKNERIKKMGLKHKSMKLLRLSSTICSERFFDFLYFAEKLKGDVPKHIVFVDLVSYYTDLKSNHHEFESLIRYVAEDYNLENYLVFFIFAQIAKKYDKDNIVESIKMINKSNYNMKFMGFFVYSFIKVYLDVCNGKAEVDTGFENLTYYNDEFLDKIIRESAKGIYHKFELRFTFEFLKLFIEIWIIEDNNSMIKDLFKQICEMENCDIRIFNDMIDILVCNGKDKLALEITNKTIWEKRFCITDLTQKFCRLQVNCEEYDKAIDAAEHLIHNQEIDCYNFKSLVRSIYTNVKQNKTMLMRLETLVNTYAGMVKLNPSLDTSDGDNVGKLRYSVLKNLYGRAHPMIKDWLMEKVDDTLNNGGYFGYDDRRKVFKYFVGTSNLQKGFEVFLKLWQKDFNYAILEKLCSLASMTGNYQIVYDKMMENFESVEDDPDNLDYVTDVLVGADRKDLAVKLWEKLAEYRGENDNKDETFFEYTMKFYRDHIGDIKKALEIFREAMDEDFFFYKYEIDELGAICFSKEKGKEFMEEFRYYVTKIERCNESVIRLYVETMRTVHSPKEMVLKLDELLKEMDVNVVDTMCDKGEQMIFKQQNILTSKEIEEDSVCGSLPETRPYVIERILALKGKESYRDLFLTNRHEGKTDLGLDYSEKKKTVTSIAEMGMVSNEKCNALERNDFGLIKILKKNEVQVHTVKSQISDFLHSLQMDMRQQMGNQLNFGEEEQKKEIEDGDMLNEENSLNLSGLFDGGDQENAMTGSESTMTAEETILVDKSDDEEEEIKEPLECQEDSTCLGVNSSENSIESDSCVSPNEDANSQFLEEKEIPDTKMGESTLKACEEEMKVVGTLDCSLSQSGKSGKHSPKKFSEIVDILGPEFQGEVIFENDLKDKNREHIMKDTKNDRDNITVLIKARAYSQAMSGDFKGGLAYLSAHFGLFNNFQNILYDYCKDHMELDDMKSLNNIFYGTLKSCFLDLMKMKTFVKSEHAKEGEDDVLCVICYDNIHEGELFSRGGCDHIFHAACSFTWIRENSNCPICRHNYTSD